MSAQNPDPGYDARRLFRVDSQLVTGMARDLTRYEPEAVYSFLSGKRLYLVASEESEIADNAVVIEEARDHRTLNAIACVAGKTDAVSARLKPDEMALIGDTGYLMKIMLERARILKGEDGREVKRRIGKVLARHYQDEWNKAHTGMSDSAYNPFS